MTGAAISPAPLLEVRDLHTRYGRVEALGGVSLSVPQGHTVSVIGANGAGKTTLMNSVMALLHSQGTVLYEGQPLQNVPLEARVTRGICLVPERRALMSRPCLLLLHEPSLGLAPLIVRDVLNIVKKLRDEGVTVLLVEQNARASLAISDEAYVLETGAVKMRARPPNSRATPNSPPVTWVASVADLQLAPESSAIG